MIAECTLCLYIMTGAATAFDLETTHRAIQRGAVESNPIMRQFVRTRATSYTVALGFGFMSIEASKRMSGKKKWIPILANVGVHVFAGIQNRRVHND